MSDKCFQKFFTQGKELPEMINMLKTTTKDPKVIKILEKYGPGFDEIYYNGIEDSTIKIAKNILAKGVDMDTISQCTGLSIKELEKLKRKL